MAILASIEQLDKLFTDRISDLYMVKGGVHYRHNFIHYRGMLYNVRNLVKKGNNSEAIQELLELGKLLHEREQDMKGDKLTMQSQHAYQYYNSIVDKIYLRIQEI